MILENLAQAEISRRDLLKKVPAVVFLVSSAVSPACQAINSLPLPNERQSSTDFFTDEKLRQLGHELGEWRVSGVQMSAVLPEVRNSVELLQGVIDPRASFPYADIPINLAYNPADGIGGLKINQVADMTDSRRVMVSQKDGRSFEMPMLKKNLKVDILLSPAVLADTIRLPIISKEASQLVDYAHYARLYLLFLQEKGISFIFKNPNDVPTSDSEIIITIAALLSAGEIESKGTSLFSDLIDVGSYIRVGGIAFANWYLDQQKEERKLVKVIGVDQGLEVADFLFKKGFIKKEGGMVIWTSGQIPGFGTKEFRDLFNELSKLVGRKNQLVAPSFKAAWAEEVA